MIRMERSTDVKDIWNDIVAAFRKRNAAQKILWLLLIAFYLYSLIILFHPTLRSHYRSIILVLPTTYFLDQFIEGKRVKRR